MKQLAFVLALCLLPLSMMAQKGSGESVLKSDKEITWLGLDFSLVHFIGPATQWQDAGEITDAAMRDKYFPAWNNLFLNEQKKYDIAKYTDRPSVKYALEVTEKVNNKTRGDYFTDDPDMYNTLTAEKVAAHMSKYNFGGKSGVGMLFLVEGMSKGREEACAWVTFVDMSSKKVLQTARITGKPGGVGFRNYWASAFFKILKSVSSEMR